MADEIDVVIVEERINPASPSYHQAVRLVREWDVLYSDLTPNVM